ncbi:MAG: hypothetical protein J0M15_08885 [Deltaproteobacteria bacterium]|nr:hypothetical protein [Deltaproteobacteria bacterium]
MKIINLFFILFVPIVIQAEILQGIARNKMGEILFHEKHEVEKDDSGLNKFIRVEYTKPDGIEFATMTSDFSKSKTVPDTTFEDKRFKTKYTIRLSNGFVEFEEIKEFKSVSKKSIPFKDTMVASQGFDNFIRLNFALLETKSVEFNFGVLDSKAFYSLTGYRNPANSPEESEYGIRASNWFFRLFAGELKVVYDSKTKQLKSFAGRSNILDDLGKPQDVVISYRWQNKP